MTAHTVWTALKNSARALRNGEFLLRVRADKLYMHISRNRYRMCIYSLSARTRSRNSPLRRALKVFLRAVPMSFSIIPGASSLLFAA